MGSVAYCDYDGHEMRFEAEEKQPVGCERGNLHTLALSVLRSCSFLLTYLKARDTIRFELGWTRCDAMSSLPWSRSNQPQKPLQRRSKRSLYNPASGSIAQSSGFLFIQPGVHDNFGARFMADLVSFGGSGVYQTANRRDERGL